MEMATHDGQEAPAENYEVEFRATGPEYFRVWIVNLLLMVVTLALFTPAARRRSLVYFHSHTLVAGSPFEFTGPLRRMFFGFLVFFGLYLAYEIAARMQYQLAASLLLLLWMAMWPWLWISSHRFRLANTRWRGITGRFTASTGSAYAASWPVLVLLVAAAGFGFFAAFAGSVAGKRMQPGAWLVLVPLGMIAILGLVTVVLDFNFLRLHVGKSSFGGLAASWQARLGELVRISLGAAGIFFLCGIAASVVIAALAAGLGWVSGGFAQAANGRPPLWAFVLPVLMLPVFLVAMAPALAYRDARRFALVWGRVRLGDSVRFDCALTPGPYVWLRTKNAFLTLLTLGMWRPFAVVSEYRMKLASLTVHAHEGVEQFTGSAAKQSGAFADAVMDAVGFDFG